MANLGTSLSLMKSHLRRRRPRRLISVLPTHSQELASAKVRTTSRLVDKPLKRRRPRFWPRSKIKLKTSLLMRLRPKRKSRPRLATWSNRFSNQRESSRPKMPWAIGKSSASARNSWWRSQKTVPMTRIPTDPDLALASHRPFPKEVKLKLILPELKSYSYS